MKNQNLGKKAKDKITGFTGVIIKYTEDLSGSEQYLLQPACENNKKNPDAKLFDKNNIEILNVQKGRVFG